MKVIKLSDVKKFIRKLKKLNISITRRLNLEGAHYDPARKKIVIPKGIHKDIPYITLIWLYHEGGHALTNPELFKKRKNSDILSRLNKFKNNRRYSRVMGELLELKDFPENLHTKTSFNIQIKKAYRNIRSFLFLEKIANTYALAEMPESFRETYNVYAVKAYAAHRKERFITHAHLFYFMMSSNLYEITKNHYF